jgi:rhodanese-related sulfurtransferase
MISEITPEALKQRIAAGEDLVLVDVRRPDEHAEKNISNSILITLDTLPDRVDELEQYRDREIILYCRSGNRSGQACMFLDLSGFANVVNLKGGMLAW